MYFTGPATYNETTPGCQHGDCNRRSYFARATDAHTSRQPASTVWAIMGTKYEDGVRKNVATIVFLCRRHTGTVRSLITRGVRGYSTRSHRLVSNVPTLTFDRPAVAAAVVRDYEAEDRLAAQQRADYIRTNKVRMMNEHLASTYHGQTIGAPSTPDEYGRVFVQFNYRKMTPGGARALAAALLVAAEAAETRMNGGSDAS